MSSLAYALTRPASAGRKVVTMALLGATFLASSLAIGSLAIGSLTMGSLTPAHADSTTGQTQIAQSSSNNSTTTTPATAPSTKEKKTKHNPAETVEQRITDLHTALKITPDEEGAWSAVAQAMRDNAANMQKLIEQKHTQATQSMTALDDLETYQAFAQAHVDGLKSLTSTFKTLYDAMPDDQKKNADAVFQNFGRHGHVSHG